MFSSSLAEAQDNPFDVQVSVTSSDGHFQVNASYVVPIDICSAFAFITDYESIKNIPGTVEAKIISRKENKVLVQKVVEEEILYFPIEMKSVVEYTETPNRMLSFEQISGDARSYKGRWTLSSDNGKTTVNYESIVEPDTSIPSIFVESFMKESIQANFEYIAKHAAQQGQTGKSACH